VPYFIAAPRGKQVELTGQDAEHLARSLRARPGEVISVVDPGDGYEGSLLQVRLDSVDPGLVRGVVEDSQPHRPEPRAEITVAIALVPAPPLEEALARCTELGVARFILIVTRRSVVRDVAPRKAERWSTICREAAMVAGRLRVPEVLGPVAPDDAIGMVKAEPVLLERSAGRRLADVDTPRDLLLLLGPEGGWSPEELSWAGESTATLGPRNLRVENAAAAGVAVALATRGDL
jgi:16S rRNA (uracil1498-N3)-methyltransferase